MRVAGGMGWSIFASDIENVYCGRYVFNEGVGGSGDGVFLLRL